MDINHHYLKLKAGYLFPEIARRVSAFAEANPDAKLIKLGIGDVTEPLPEACIIAMHKAVDDLSNRQTFHGYGPEQGYPWLRELIAEHDYQARGCDIAADEVFVSDGSKCDTGNILDILGPSPKVAVCDPVYPVYVDTNVMAGHTGWPDKEGRYDGLTYLPMTADNGFEPPLPTEPVDVVYLCYPNNPTGAVASRETLQQWVDWCNAHDALLLFDAAYAAFIRSKDTPRSIYELEGARRCAIEFRSLSKNAGFTGVRCAFTIVPKELTAKGPDGVDTPLHALWSRRQSTKFNGVSYITQRGAAAVYSEDGQAQVAKLVEHYMGNADLIRESLTAAGHTVHGGQHAPYVWVATPEGIDSWGFFDQLLEQHHVVGTPGAGFGASGEGYLRLSAFNSREAVEEAMQRLTGSPAAA